MRQKKRAHSTDKQPYPRQSRSLGLGFVDKFSIADTRTLTANKQLYAALVETVSTLNSSQHFTLSQSYFSQAYAAATKLVSGTTGLKNPLTEVMQKKLVKVVITTYQMMLKGGKHTGFILTNPKNVSILVEHACRQLPAEFTQRTIIGPGKIEKSSLAWLALILPTAINTAFAPDKIVNEMKPGNHEETHNRALYRLRMRG